jgi:hypothetical protein
MVGPGGVPRQSKFNSLHLQTCGSARIEPKGHFGAVTNRKAISRKQRIANERTGRPSPIPETRSPGAGETATGVEVRRVLQKTNQNYSMPNVNAIPVLRRDGGDSETPNRHQNATVTEATTPTSDKVTPLIAGARAGHGVAR